MSLPVHAEDAIVQAARSSLSSVRLSEGTNDVVIVAVIEDNIATLRTGKRVALHEALRDMYSQAQYTSVSVAALSTPTPPDQFYLLLIYGDGMELLTVMAPEGSVLN